MRLTHPLMVAAMLIPLACVSPGQAETAAEEAPSETTTEAAAEPVPAPPSVPTPPPAPRETQATELEVPVPVAAAVGGAPQLDVTQLSATEVVKRFEDALRGDTSYLVAEMTITTPRWTRSLRFRSWDDGRNDRSFIRILAPKKDRGTGFMRQERTLWTYLPRVERVTRIPPSMMMQSWMGSDFTNDDIARESSVVDDYDATKLPPREIDGVLALGVRLIPKPEAPIVWAKLELWASAENFAPLLEEFYDEPDPGRFELVRSLRFTDVRMVQGRPVPHSWRMESLDKPGQTTEFTLEEIQFDVDFEDDIFTQANLKRAEAVR